MKDQYIGKFDLGYENVMLYAREGSGGEFITNPDATIWIGIGSPDWCFVFQTLLHEVAEYASFRAKARFSPDHDSSVDCGSFLFSMDHATFSDVCGRVAKYMVPAIPFLREAWEKYHDPRKSKKVSGRKIRKR